MWRFRACPKCGGDLYVDCDVNGCYEECLQCGYLHDLGSMFEVSEAPEKPRKVARTDRSEKRSELALARGHYDKFVLL